MATPPRSSDTLTVGHSSAPDKTDISERLRATPPLALYFHNDEPEPRSRATTTQQTYGTTFTAYEAWFPKYLMENDEPSAISDFFAERVRAGRVRLDTLVDDLTIALENGYSVTLEVRGFASPLALNDYNNALSRRRIESLRMHLLKAKGGILLAYMDSTAKNGGILRIHPLPFGEERSAQGVSDALSDLKHSVYSVGAARERRIEVERILVDPAKTNAGIQQFSVGTVSRGAPQHFEVPVKNERESTLRLLSGNAGCECILVDRLPPPIEPGGTGILRIRYSGRSLAGPLERTITFQTDGTPEQFELIITGTVEP